MTCFKCGKELNVNDKWCYSCGALNFNHPDNKSTIDFYKQSNISDTSNNINNNTENFSNNSTETVIQNDNTIDSTISQNYNSIESNSNLSIKNYFPEISLAFIIVNVICFIILLLPSIKLFSLNSGFLIGTCIAYFYIFCFQLLFIKANLPWWGILIPIYNIYLFNKLAFGNGWVFLIPSAITFIARIFIKLNIFILASLFLKLITPVTLIYSFFLLFCLGKRFGRSGLLTVLLAFAIIPGIALSSRFQYEY